MNILITGAGSGIGYDTVKELSRDPANRILALSRNETNLRRLLDETAAAGNVQVLPLDITDFDAAELAGYLEPYGVIDILIHNAGTLNNKPFEALTLKDWRDTFEVNVFGVVRITQVLLPFLKQSKQPHIVMIGSMGGFQGSSKFPGLTAYSASKAALANLTECLAEELKADQIKVNCLALGAVNTDMMRTAFPDYKAPVEPNEISRFITYFSLHAHSFLNGKVIPVSITTP